MKKVLKKRKISNGKERLFRSNFVLELVRQVINL